MLTKVIIALKQKALLKEMDTTLSQMDNVESRLDFIGEALEEIAKEMIRP